MMRNSCPILLRKPEGKPTAKIKHREKNNIKVYVKELECKDVHWIHLAYGLNGRLL
jgi:hypothetical protein